MPQRSSVLAIALLVLGGCAERSGRAEPAVGSDVNARWHAPAARPLPRVALPPPAADHRPALDPESAAVLKEAYRFELTLHASDADIAEFGGFFLDCPAVQEGEFLAEFARVAPPVRQRRWCRFTPGQSVIDLMTGKAGASFVAEIKDLDLPRAEGLVTMSWWSDPELGGGALMALRKQAGRWEVTGYQLMWIR